MKKLIIMVFVLLINFCYGQASFDYKGQRHKFNKFLINENKKNNTIKKINASEEFEGKFLGNVKTVTGKEYYLVNSSYVFDINSLAKTENHIFVYNDKKQFVGYYYLGQMYELPKRLDDNKLYFEIKDCKEKITIDFSKGIPRAINLKCNNSNNYYEFKSH